MKGIILIIFSYLLSSYISIIPEWDLSKSAVDLLSSSTTYEYTVCQKYFYNYELKMIKRLTKTNGNIISTNRIYINNKVKEVPFDNIESFFYLNGKYIICPIGKYHPYDFTNEEYIVPNNFKEVGNWDLKCQYHGSSRYIIISYSSNGIYNLYATNSDITNTKYVENVGEELYDYKLNDTYKQSCSEYSMINFYKVKQNLMLTSSIFILMQNYPAIIIFSIIPTNELLTNTKGFFKKDSDYFYLITYNDIQDFSSGFTNSTIDDYRNITNVKMYFNFLSPFEFMDEVEIKEINFILFNKFVYYKLYNKNNDKFYHGIIDIELNKVIFNTDETITSFLPFSDKAMLAITPSTAYKICAYNENGNCIDTCNEGYVLDISGNKCGTSCPSGKIKLMPSEVCAETCDLSIYVLNNNQCGLCKYFNPNGNKYKLINGTNCLGSIPDGAEFFNEKLSLLKCKDGYHLEDNTCKKDIICYELCEDCVSYSSDIHNQKCLKCKAGYLLENGNCLKQCSKGYEKFQDICKYCNDNICQNFEINSCNCLECPAHYYLNDYKCKECDLNCLECYNSSNNCTKCFDSDFLFNNKCLQCTDCKEKETDSCKCKSCLEGYFLENYQCKKCLDNCKNCENSSKCISCKDGYTLENAICVKCHINCELCSAPSYTDEEQNCISCKDNNKFIFETNCVNECPNNSYIFNNKECKKCSLHCKTCDKGEEMDNENCLSCDENNEYKYLVDAEGFGKNCVKECPDKTELKDGKCISKSVEENESNYVVISLGILFGFCFVIIVIMICLYKKKCLKCLKDKKDDKLIKEINDDLKLYKSFD